MRKELKRTIIPAQPGYKAIVSPIWDEEQLDYICTEPIIAWCIVQEEGKDFDLYGTADTNITPLLWSQMDDVRAIINPDGSVEVFMNCSYNSVEDFIKGQKHDCREARAKREIEEAKTKSTG